MRFFKERLQSRRLHSIRWTLGVIIMMGSKKFILSTIVAAALAQLAWGQSSDAQRKRDSAQPQEAQRKGDSAQPQEAQRKRDSAQPQEAQRKRDSAQPQEAQRK